MNKIKNTPQPNPGVINVVNEKNVLASLESCKLNCHIEEELIATYMMAPDTSLNSNVMINQGEWIVEESEEEND